MYECCAIFSTCLEGERVIVNSGNLHLSQLSLQSSERGHGALVQRLISLIMFNQRALKEVCWLLGLTQIIQSNTGISPNLFDKFSDSFFLEMNLAQCGISCPLLYRCHCFHSLDANENFSYLTETELQSFSHPSVLCIHTCLYSHIHNM